MINMSDYAKSVFDDPKLLREKLKIYLKTPEKVEIYAAACEKFYLNGGKNGLKKQATWSWWAFFCTFAFFMYRRRYMVMILYIIGSIFSIFAMIQAGMVAKWHVCKAFLESLEAKDDDILMANGGVNKFAILFLIVFGVIIPFIFSLILTFALYNTDYDDYEYNETPQTEQLENSSKNTSSKVLIEAPEVQVHYDFDFEDNSYSAMVRSFFGTGDNSFGASPNLISIISKDNNTQIQDVVVNRGNCPIFKYRGINKTKLKEYADKYPQNVKIINGKEVVYLSKKDGGDTEVKNISKNDKKTVEYLNSLTDEARDVYDYVFPFTLNFGEKKTLNIGCDYSTVLEVVVQTNGGLIKYDMSRM